MPYFSATILFFINFIMELSYREGIFSFIWINGATLYGYLLLVLIMMVIGQIGFVILFFDYNHPKQIENTSELSKSRKHYRNTKDKLVNLDPSQDNSIKHDKIATQKTRES